MSELINPMSIEYTVHFILYSILNIIMRIPICYILPMYYVIYFYPLYKYNVVFIDICLNTCSEMYTNEYTKGLELGTTIYYEMCLKMYCYFTRTPLRHV